MTAASLPRAGQPMDPAAARSTRLAESMRSLRTRAAGEQLERALLIIGGVLMPLGVVFIILGWEGAAHTPLAFEQNDYMISGGLLGLALVIAGGFTYFAYWQTVRIRESRRQSADLTAAMQRVEALLEGVLAGDTPGAATRTFVATSNGSLFHRRECRTVAGREDLQQVDPATTSLRPCRICNPLDA